MKKIALMFVLLLASSVGFGAMAAEQDAAADGAKKEVSNQAVLKATPAAFSAPSIVAAALGGLSGMQIGLIAGGVAAVAVAASSTGTSGTR